MVRVAVIAPFLVVSSSLVAAKCDMYEQITPPLEHYLGDLDNQRSNSTLLGGKGYLSTETQLNLCASANIRRDTTKRNKPLFSLFIKSGKRIEKLFSQMCQQFMVTRHYAKSFDGFRTRILTKITAIKVIQCINKNILNRNINNVKIGII